MPAERFTPTGARLADDLELDEAIAVADARARVADAHGRAERAEMWREITATLANVRAEQRQLSDAADDGTLPTVDLGRLDDDEDDTGDDETN